MVNINEGTQTTIYTDTVGTAQAQVIRLDVGSGTNVSAFTGTVAAVTNLAGGTVGEVTSITNLAGGTIWAVNSGTVGAYQVLNADPFGTTISTGTNTLGTIKAAVSGSQIYVTDLVISAGSATNVEIASGGTSTPILGTLFLNANGGAVMNFQTPLWTAIGSALVYKQSTGGPLTITATGYVD